MAEAADDREVRAAREVPLPSALAAPFGVFDAAGAEATKTAGATAEHTRPAEVRLVGDRRSVIARPRSSPKATAGAAGTPGVAAAGNGCDNDRGPVSQVVDSLDAARKAAARFAWREAYDAYSGVDRADLTADDLERFAEAAWWRGKLDEAIAPARARVRGVHRSRRHARRGTDRAHPLLGLRRPRRVLRRQRMVRKRRAPARGPARVPRARPLAPDAGPHGDVRGGRPRGARTAPSRRPFELAQRVGDRDVQILALSGQARALIKAGNDRARACPPRRGDRLGDVAATCCRTRPASSTASRSALAATWATTAARPSGRRRRTGGATASTSRASLARAASTGPRS